MIRGKLLLGYTRDALHQCSVFSDKKGTKEPVHSRDGGLYGPLPNEWIGLRVWLRWSPSFGSCVRNCMPVIWLEPAKPKTKPHLLVVEKALYSSGCRDLKKNCRPNHNDLTHNINSIEKIISHNAGVLSKLPHFLTSYSLILLYNVLILPHLNNCNILAVTDFLLIHA